MDSFQSHNEHCRNAYQHIIEFGSGLSLKAAAK